MLVRFIGTYSIIPSNNLFFSDIPKKEGNVDEIGENEDLFSLDFEKQIEEYEKALELGLETPYDSEEDDYYDEYWNGEDLVGLGGTSDTNVAVAKKAFKNIVAHDLLRHLLKRLRFGNPEEKAKKRLWSHVQKLNKLKELKANEMMDNGNHGKMRAVKGESPYQAAYGKW
ncbi:unnamed protein product [Cylicocyclus nassatus]|uniref:Uncharacterized protein n=1 Tax=Cylicocyclus nassatus TaxID=53992 RepID=A0AA36H7B8_CYLNA|nr:unnamed protein product [Cylicocyclus nassatus]